MTILRCLRPSLQVSNRPIPKAAFSAFLRFYNAAQAQVEPRIRTSDETLEYTPELYPRIKPQKGALDYKTFAERYRSLGRGDSSTDEVVLRGMLPL